jgi:hypothetical protein
LYYYASALTPAVSLVAPPPGAAALDAIGAPGAIVIHGDRLSANASDYEITLDGSPCAVESVAVGAAGGGSVACRLPPLPAGPRRLRVRVAGRGHAEMPASMASLLATPAAARAPPSRAEALVGYVLNVTAAAPATGSFWGGAALNVTAWGLAATDGATGAPPSPSAPVVAASVAGAGPGGAAVAAALAPEGAAAAGWAAVAVARFSTPAATPASFSLSIKLQVLDPTFGDVLGSATTPFLLNKTLSPAIASASIAAPSNGSARATVSWSVRQGNASALAGAGAAAPPWAALLGAGGPSVAAAALQAVPPGAASAAGGPPVECLAPVATSAFLNDTHYIETLECDLPAYLPAASYTAWGEPGGGTGRWRAWQARQRRSRPGQHFVVCQASPPCRPRRAVCVPVLGCGWLAAAVAVPLVVTGVLPAGGSAAGGTNVTLSGSGASATARLRSRAWAARQGVRHLLSIATLAARPLQCPSQSAYPACPPHTHTKYTLTTAADRCLAAGFGSDPSAVAVLFGVSACAVTASNATTVACVTSPSAGYGAAQLLVTPSQVRQPGSGFEGRCGTRRIHASFSGLHADLL